MYQIAQDTIAAVNGLGLTDAGVSLIKAGIDAATSITNNAVNARNARKTAEATGTATTTYTPCRGLLAAQSPSLDCTL